MRRSFYFLLAAMNAVIAVICIVRAMTAFEGVGSQNLAAAIQDNQITASRPAATAVPGSVQPYASAPLFQKDRRFPVQSVVAQRVVEVAQTPPQPVGTITSNAGESWALLLDPQTQLLTKVALSGEIAGWRIEAISEKSVVFARETETIELQVRR